MRLARQVSRRPSTALASILVPLPASVSAWVVGTSVGSMKQIAGRAAPTSTGTRRTPTLDALDASDAPPGRGALSHSSASVEKDALFDVVSNLVEQGRRIVATQTNAMLTLTHWRIGQVISEHVLGQERADYGRQIVASLARQLTGRYGRGFDEKTLRLDPAGQAGGRDEPLTSD